MSMTIGPFALLPGQLAITEQAPIEVWEENAKLLFDMQKHVPWWIGDLVVFGEARFGDDFWQIPPMDASEKMIQRFAGVSRVFKTSERLPGLSWTHHITAMRIKSPKLRTAFLRQAEEHAMDTQQFSEWIRGME
jgi:hypothetical protein